MPGENLTRTEAIERASIVTTHSYDIALDLTTGPEVFRTETTVRFAAQPGASTFIDLITDRVLGITLNGLRRDAATARRAGETVTVVVDGELLERTLAAVTARRAALGDRTRT